jgi:hypothetical protein
MRVQDLLDQVVFDSGDNSSAYRTAARRWLNLARSYIADDALWKTALRPDATLTTDAAKTRGLYLLRDDSSQDYEFVAGDVLYDETNRQNIVHESMVSARMVDQAKETFSKPTIWADAGDDGNGVRQIYLWPIPSAAYTITFPGYIKLTDLTDSDDNLTVDPFFGPISPWAACMTQGLRFFHDQNNNEDVQAMMLQELRFQKRINRRKANNRLSPSGRMALAVIKTQRLNYRGTGRFDPAHFNNRRSM